MEFRNLNDPDERVDFPTAVVRGLGNRKGLFFPCSLPALGPVDDLLALPFHHRSALLLGALTGGVIPPGELEALVAEAFDFPVVLRRVDEATHCLELFHGPTAAFKDFGARFLARCLARFSPGPTTILTATSGDTGAAVADAFFGLDGIRIVVLYPEGRVSPVQEALFANLGGNVEAVAVQADFDRCQALVKEAFADPGLTESIRLNSANSINLGRLVAQVTYYFEAVAMLPPQRRGRIALAVPSGNFGNLTAALWAMALGLPVARLVAATNANDTVPRYLAGGTWDPRATVRTMSNAMDISEPNNWPRVEAMRDWMPAGFTLEAWAVTEEQTRDSLRRLHAAGYLADPHGAVAAQALGATARPDEEGIFLGTAHPAKFAASVEQILGVEVPVPARIARLLDRPNLRTVIPGRYEELRSVLLAGT